MNPQMGLNPQIEELISNGWRVTSDGPTGTQLEAPKRIRTSELVAIFVGVVLLPFFGLGLFIIGAAVVDYVRRKPATKFIFKV
jgi:hypothetical protein